MSLSTQDREQDIVPVWSQVASDLPAPPGITARVLEDDQRALLNILEDFAAERSDLAAGQRAIQNILEDSMAEKEQLAATERATLNILEDLDQERGKAELINQLLQSEIEVRKQAESTLKDYTDELARSNADLQQFAYVASHDLQEPLRSIGSFSQLLTRRYKGKLGSDADEFIEFIVDGAARMQSLINDLLAFSRVGTKGNPFITMDCSDALESAKANLHLSIEESGALITHDPLPVVSADQLQLTQLFQNLIGNAIKFRRPAETPHIHVIAVRQFGAWLLAVRDNGIGIDPQYYERIFVIFQRLHGREEYSGTGIGLAICKKIVERRGGRMWVESEPGNGSTFLFTIPDESRTHDNF